MILPIQAALERVPGNLIEASADLGARPAQTFATWYCRWRCRVSSPARSSLFADAGRLHHPAVVGTSRLFIGQAVYALQGTAGNIPLAAAFTVVPM